jgi:hypothetical protein
MAQRSATGSPSPRTTTPSPIAGSAVRIIATAARRSQARQAAGRIVNHELSAISASAATAGCGPSTRAATGMNTSAPPKPAKP